MFLKRIIRKLVPLKIGICIIQKELALLWFMLVQKTPFKKEINKINLCSGSTKVTGYFNIDISGADLNTDLAKKDLFFFADNSIESIVCMSAINYFTRRRATELIKEVYRILKPNGTARFGVQNLEKLAQLYVNKDKKFFFQKIPNGRDRFEGPTIGDKFVAWFYGYVAGGYPCKYFYDYDSLAYIFKAAGFSVIERMDYRNSRLEHIDLIDNRHDQMFFLEAVK